MVIIPGMTTLRDIAKAAGVSVTTVSRVLNDSASEIGIADATQDKVRQAARRLQYQPNRAARNLRMGKRPRAILFVSAHTNSNGISQSGTADQTNDPTDGSPGNQGFLAHPFFAEVMHALQRNVQQTGCYLAYVAVQDDNLKSTEQLVNDAVSGVITWGILPDPWWDMLQASGLPVAALEPYPGFRTSSIPGQDPAGSDPTPPPGETARGADHPPVAHTAEAHAWWQSSLHQVYVDNEMAVRLAVEHLLDQGYERLYLIGAPQEGRLLNPVFQERTAAFCRLADRLSGISAAVVKLPASQNRSDIDLGIAAGDWLVANTGQSGAVEPPVGLIAVNDLTAVGILAAARAHRVRVPQGWGVVGIDDVAWARYQEPPLSTIRIPKEQLASAAVRFVTQRLAGQNEPAQTLRVPVELVMRQSTLLAGP